MGTKIEFTNAELTMVGVALWMTAMQIAMSRDVVQDMLNNNEFDGLSEILPAMDIIKITNQELELLEQVATKIEQIIHSKD